MFKSNSTNKYTDHKIWLIVLNDCNIHDRTATSVYT